MNMDHKSDKIKQELIEKTSHSGTCLIKFCVFGFQISVVGTYINIYKGWAMSMWERNEGGTYNKGFYLKGFTRLAFNLVLDNKNR